MLYWSSELRILFIGSERKTHDNYCYSSFTQVSQGLTERHSCRRAVGNAGIRHVNDFLATRTGASLAVELVSRAGSIEREGSHIWQYNIRHLAIFHVIHRNCLNIYVINIYQAK